MGHLQKQVVVFLEIASYSPSPSRDLLLPKLFTATSSYLSIYHHSSTLLQLLSLMPNPDFELNHLLQKNKRLCVYGSGSPMNFALFLSCMAINLSFNGAVVLEKISQWCDCTFSCSRKKNGFAHSLGCGCTLHPSSDRKTPILFRSPFSFLHLVQLLIPSMVRLCFSSSLSVFSPSSSLLDCLYFHFLWCLFFPFSDYSLPFLLHYSHSRSFLFW